MTRSLPLAVWPLRLWRDLARLAWRRRGETAGSSTPTPVIVKAEAPSAADRLACTYAGSLLEVALRLEALRDGGARADLGTASIASLVDGVAAELDPLARRAGLRLLHLRSEEEPAEWVTDAGLLRLVLRHLALRALVGEAAPGVVRMDVAVDRREAQVRVLTRAATKPTRRRALDGVSELSALQRLLATLGGAVVIEPRRGGYAPLIVALRAPPPESGALRQAA